MQHLKGVQEINTLGSAFSSHLLFSLLNSLVHPLDGLLREKRELPTVLWPLSPLWSSLQPKVEGLPTFLHALLSLGSVWVLCLPISEKKVLAIIMRATGNVIIREWKIYQFSIFQIPFLLHKHK